MKHNWIHKLNLIAAAFNHYFNCHAGGYFWRSLEICVTPMLFSMFPTHLHVVCCSVCKQLMVGAVQPGALYQARAGGSWLMAWQCGTFVTLSWQLSWSCHEAWSGPCSIRRSKHASTWSPGPGQCIVCSVSGAQRRNVGRDTVGVT